MKLALNQQEAAEALGCSVNHFKSNVRPHVKAVYIGSVRRWRPEDLDAWLKRQQST